MFASRAYKTVLCLGLGTSVVYSYKDEIKRNVRNPWANIHAAVAEPQAFPNLTKQVRQRWDSNWDKREPVSKPNEAGDGVIRPKATRHIILIRHGQYNMEGETDVERVLTTLGQLQAKMTGERLKTLGLDIATIYESSMTRAKETSAIIQKTFPEVEVQRTDLLREGAPIEPVPSHPSWKPPQNQFHEDGPRIEAGFRKFIHRADSKQEKDSVEVFVCHANVIRYFVCRALQFPPEGWLRMGLYHGSITWLSIRPNGRVSIRCLGDAGHMPPDKLTFN